MDTGDLVEDDWQMKRDYATFHAEPIYVKLPEYAALYPDRVTHQATGTKAGRLRVKTGNGLHFTEWAKALVLGEAREKRRVKNKLILDERRERNGRRLAKIEANKKRREDERAQKERIAKAVADRKEIEKSVRVQKHEANMELSRLREEARAIRRELLKKWEKKYGHLFRRERPSDKRRWRQKRKILEDLSCVDRKKTYFSIRMIHEGPCKCYWCGVMLINGGEVDHIVPLAKGGLHGSWNLVPSCPPCNRKKHATMPNESSVVKQCELHFTHG